MSYRRRDIEAAVACKDFEVEAVLMLLKVDPDLAGDEEIIQKTAETLELGFRKEKENNWPDMEGLEVFFVERKRTHQEFGIIAVTEVVLYPDGTLGEVRLQTSQRKGQGWRVLNVLPDEDERIQRHNIPIDKNDVPDEPGRYADAIVAHVQKFWGPSERIILDADPEYARIDVHLVKATAERPYHTLITSGMSSKDMPVPEGAEELKLAELVISLPPDWPVDDKSLKDEKKGWPFQILKELARFPHAFDAFLFYGHTVPNTDHFLPYASNTKLCSMLLALPVLPEDGCEELVIDDATKIHFLSIIPIYREEWDFTVKKGSSSDALLDRLGDADVTELVDIKRKNVCK